MQPKNAEEKSRFSSTLYSQGCIKSAEVGPEFTTSKASLESLHLQRSQNLSGDQSPSRQPKPNPDQDKSAVLCPLEKIEIMENIYPSQTDFGFGEDPAAEP